MIAPVVRVERGRDEKLAGVHRVEAQRARTRIALDAAFARAGMPAARPRSNEDGAPLPQEGWHWSQSHTRDCSAAVVSSARVGIDVEPIELRKAAQFRSVVSDAERDLCAEIDALLFTRLWTAKESVLKRCGVGLAELSDCRIARVNGAHEMWLTHRGTTHVVQQSIAHGFVVSLAAGVPGNSPIEWTWSA